MKSFYETHHDQIAEKRYDSKYPIRRAVHGDIYDSVLQWIPAGARVLDAGCGEGVLSCLMAERGARVHAIDYSRPNIEAARARATRLGGACAGIVFDVGDAEQLAFPDRAFDVVVSNHVLEHIPDFRRGIAELYRVTAKTAVVAVPTCLNPCSWALLGGDKYWRIGRRTPYAVPLGIARVARAWLAGEIGVDETYAGRDDNTHIFRFPRVVHAELVAAGFDVVRFEAQSIRLPYVAVDLSRLRAAPGFRHCGLGTVYLLERPR
jgi:2-polyprenyl-3-methyl-5-hydroxy-6-metoxy-1,4-benzoquinol methylase